MAEGKKAWNPDTMGYGKHEYHHIDKDTVNPEDYAVSLRGEEKHFGAVRQYNSAYNEKHEENDCDLDWLGRLGTVFETNAEGYEGIWHITNMPVVKTPIVFCRAVKVGSKDEEPGEDGEEVTLSCVELGCAVGADNLYLQVRTKLLKRGAVDRKQRLRLTQRNK